VSSIFSLYKKRIIYPISGAITHIKGEAQTIACLTQRTDHPPWSKQYSLLNYTLIYRVPHKLCQVHKVSKNDDYDEKNGDMNQPNSQESQELI
jgi:hypothetical protein